MSLLDKSKKQLLIGGLAILALIFVTSQLGVPPVGRLDFRAYWSAAYLLAHLQNFADPEMLRAIQQNLTGYNKDWAMMTWNLPWMLTLFIPYTLFSFSHAAWLWLFTNIILIFVGVVWFWQTLNSFDEERSPSSLYAILLAFFFAPTLFVLLAGQVGSLVFLGLAGFLYFYQQHKDGRAGGLLVLTLIKPHIIYLPLVLILLQALRQKRWGVIYSFLGGSVFLIGITFILRPLFVMDYWHTMMDATQTRLLRWENATLGGITATFGWGHQLKYIGIIVLPLAFVWWQRYAYQLDMVVLVLVSLPISVLTAPFGWAYDQVVLLLPLLQIFRWLWIGKLKKLSTFLLAIILLVANLFAFYLRWITVSDSYYIYYTVTIAIVFYALFFRYVSRSTVNNTG